MFRLHAPRVLVATSLVFAFGCGSGGGCGGFKPLPADPKPLGFPTDQLIEGGIQARITKPGLDKLLSTITGLFGGLLGNGFCASEERNLFNFVQKVDVCQQPSAVCSGNTGCSAYVYLDSKDRPASHVTGDVMPPPPANNQDGKLKITVSMNESPPDPDPVITVDVSLDVLVPLKLTASGFPVTGSCYLYAYTKHVDNNNEDPLHVILKLKLSTDPTTGKLAIKLDDLQIPMISLTTDGVGGACGFISTITSAVLGFLDSLPGFIKNFITGLLTGPINNIIQGFLPDPLGIANVIDTGSLLSSLHPPKDASLEAYVVPGGYVHSKAGGLTLGVMSGINSDRDESTRSPGMTSEPNLCVPTRPTHDLAGPPWNLPFNAPRKDFLLAPANEFSGNPDPVDSTGQPQDVAIGISRTFLDLAGFHIFNSGTLCLSIGGDAIPQLNAGTIAVIVGSLGNILEDRKAGLALVLRPQTPLAFTVGAGTMMDPLIHIGITDLRIDFYAWIEERYVRLLTLGADINAGLNLTITKDAQGKPAVQPMLVGVDASHVVIRVTNTDLVSEDPKELAKVFPSLINIAAGALGGGIKPISLPSIMGFSLDGLSMSRVQTSQDDFLGIFATIKSGVPAPLMDWTDPQHPHVVGGVSTLATVRSVDVPKQDELRKLFADGAQPQMFADTAKPRVTLHLDADHKAGRPVEFGWRVDGGFWRPWTTETMPMVVDDAFLLQGRHTIEVRSRVVNEWATEDMNPVKLSVLIDSMPPELHPARDDQNQNRLVFGGFDIVSDAAELKYAWTGSDGRQTMWTSDDGMSVDEARRLTDDGRTTLHLVAKDEAGNIGEANVDLAPLLGFHGRTTAPSTSGCGCTIGGAGDGGAGAMGGGLVVAFMGLLVFLRRRRAQALATLALLTLGIYAAGCGCDTKGLQCSVDDDCAKMTCAAGQLATCQESMCLCSPDIPAGDTGRFSSMALSGQTAYIAAYNTTYGDLMIGSVTPPAVVANWDYVDGVPDETPSLANSHVRGGINSKGDDVGRYTSIQITKQGDPVVAYYDSTHHALKFASFGVIRWRSQVVDKSPAAPEGEGDDIGRWASLTLGPDGTPAIAYTAIQRSGTMSKMPEGQLRWAQATSPNPQGPSDWVITTLDSRPLPNPNAVPDGGTPPDADAGAPAAPAVDPFQLPEGIALMPAVARRSDGSPGIAYYDRTRGNLRYIEFVSTMSKWSTPVILDGEDTMGNDTADVGQYPSLGFDEKDVGHISYVDATHDNLLYTNLAANMPEVVDDGYRPKDESTLDGLDSPVFHLVGDSSSIQLALGQIVIAYQDSTVSQLRVAQKGMDGKWVLSTVAGHANPFKGAYGFYANLKISGGRGVVSSYAINQHVDPALFYVEVFSVDLGLIM